MKYRLLWGNHPRQSSYKNGPNGEVVFAFAMMEALWYREPGDREFMFDYIFLQSRNMVRI